MDPNSDKTEKRPTPVGALMWALPIFAVALVIAGVVTWIMDTDDPSGLFLGTCFVAFIILFLFVPTAAYLIWGTKEDAPKMPWPIGVYIAAMILPLGFFGAGLFWAISDFVDGLDTETTEGIVVRFEKREGQNGPSYRPVVEYGIGEARYRRTGNWGGKAFRIGSSVQVRYKADHPETGFIDSFSQRWLGPLVLLAAGIIFGTFVLAGLKQSLIGKPSRKDAEKMPLGYVQILWWRWRI